METDKSIDNLVNFLAVLVSEALSVLLGCISWFSQPYIHVLPGFLAALFLSVILSLVALAIAEGLGLSTSVLKKRVGVFFILRTFGTYVLLSAHALFASALAAYPMIYTSMVVLVYEWGWDLLAIFRTKGPKVRRDDRAEVNDEQVQETRYGLRMFRESDIDYKNGRKIGQGKFGYVELVKVKGYSAPKVLKRSHNPNRNLTKHLEAMGQIGVHPNILEIIGCVEINNEICPISSHCELGDLRQLCKNNKIAPSDDVLLPCLGEIARGLTHMHEHRVVHRDLRAKNIFVRADRRVVIGDFGMSRLVDDSEDCYFQDTESFLPVRWMAPECLENKNYTFKGDIWSLGVTIYELLTRGGLPYHNEWKYPKVVKDIQEGRKRLFDRVPDDLAKKAGEIGRRCMNLDHHQRPDAGQLVTLIETTRQYESDAYVNV